MFSYLLQSSELSTLLRFVSPAFFRVVPMAEVLGVGARLKKNASDLERFSALKQGVAERFEKQGASVRLAAGQDVKGSQSQSSAEDRQQVLEAYFLQILSAPLWILDFRKEAFLATPGGLLWDPRPYFWEPTPVFAEGVRLLYRGFYEDSPSLFEQALTQLRLEVAGPALRKHFGEGDQTAVRFELKAFQNSFAEVFEACAKAGTQIPSEFSVLGLMLLSLYENLETQGAPLDVRAAFFHAQKKAAGVA